ncbi:MAG: hypothetical protein KDE20_28830, partial [Caldilineaceae bacterium]|nr:hypothetical protein [Caldilineaceae bacterium]
YRRGEAGAQHLAWIATFDLDACVWTNAPGGSIGASLGAMGDWNGSTSLPRVVQCEDVALILYNPSDVLRAVFPQETHAWFPRAAFDEVRTRGKWNFARKGDGYVALYSALPATWTTSGPDADHELVAAGARNAWICQVGGKSEDGSFDDFVAAVSQATVTTTGAGNDPASHRLAVEYQAPGVGKLELDWDGAPLRDGATVQTRGFD